jgi:Protein tyrosine and serine/threonine kinase
MKPKCLPVVVWHVQCVQVADGMAFLHSAKRPILHRDLRCANVLVDKNGKVKVSTCQTVSVRGHSVSAADQEGLEFVVRSIGVQGQMASIERSTTNCGND